MADHSETDLLVPYRPGSRGPSPGTLIPANLASAAQAALGRLQHQVGDIDEFVRQRLGYDSATEMFKVLYAEQIDSAAFAFWQGERGKAFLNADQTGNGKGRWAGTQVIDTMQSEKTAVWITQQPDLYAAALADLADLGKTNLRVFVTNNNFKLTLPDGKELKTGSAAKQEAEMQRILAGESKYDLIFSTYSQLQTVNKKEPFRREFFKQFAPNAVFILDEAHQGGGQTGVGSSNENTRSVFVRQIVDKGAGVVFATATAVKNPDILDLYARRTDAVDVISLSTLQDALHNGGIPLQQMIAAKFVESGQMLRRERSYEGVKLNLQNLPVDREAADQLYTCMGAISRFEVIKDAVVEDMRAQLKEQAKAVLGDSATGDVGARSTNFTSLMHNVVSQSSLGLVADSIVEIAIAARDRGQKPVIACVSTMESHLTRYSEEMGIQPGDLVNLTYADLLQHNLERSREVRTKDFQGTCEQRPLTDSELGVHGIAAYQKAMTLIQSTDLASVPISFIDYVKWRLEAAGISVSEITGRKTGLDYSSADGPTYAVRAGSDTTPQAKVDTVNRFNNGQLDALVINSAGFTGISIQASERFADQAQRHLIVAQIHGDINQVMQMFGRVNRFGQVNAPEITVAFGDLPASRRIAALLSERMARLNANTTANRESALSCVTASQFFSSYGEAAIEAILKEYPEYNSKLAYPRDAAGDGELTLISRVTGRMPLMSIADQEALYKLIDTEVASLIELDNLTGRNRMAAEQLDLDARTLGRIELVPAVAPGNPFGGAVYAEKVDVKRQVQPMTQIEVINAVRSQVGLSPVSVLQHHDPTLFTTAAQTQAKQQQQEVRAITKAFRQEMKTLLDASDMKAVTERLDRYSSHLLNCLATFPAGTAVELRLPSGHKTYGVVGRILQGNDRGNPLALSNWRVEIYTQDFARLFPVRMSAFNGGSKTHRVDVTPASVTWEGEDIYTAFDSRQGKMREERIILRGNLLTAYEKYPIGDFAYYTAQTGERLAGMVLPQGFDLEEALKNTPALFHTAVSAKQFLGVWTDFQGQIAVGVYGTLQSAAKDSGNLVFNASYAIGGRLYRDEELIAKIGQDFYSVGDQMRAEVKADCVDTVLRYLMIDLKLELTAASHVDTARNYLGQQPPEWEWLAEEELFQTAFDFIPAPYCAQGGDQPLVGQETAINTINESVEPSAEVKQDLPQLSQELPLPLSENLQTAGAPIAAATLLTPMGDLNLEIFEHDADYLRLECTGATANWAEFPQTERVDFVSRNDLAEMETPLLSQYAEFAVEQIHGEFMQQLSQEATRIAPELHRWLKDNSGLSGHQTTAFWEQYPNRERTGLSPEFMQLAIQTALGQIPLSDRRSEILTLQPQIEQQTEKVSPSAAINPDSQMSPRPEADALARIEAVPVHQVEQNSSTEQPLTLITSAEAPSCSARDPQQWGVVREVLIQDLQLAERYVDTLHERKLVDADNQGNLMFIQHRVGDTFSRGEANGVALYDLAGQVCSPSGETDSSSGYFWFQQGKGRVQEVVVAATGLDAVGFAMSHQRPAGGSTVYLALDGQDLPLDSINQVMRQGGTVVLAEGINPEVAHHLQIATSPVQAISQAVSGPIESSAAPASVIATSTPSSTDASSTVTIQDIRQWYRQAGEIGRSDKHLNQIAQVGMAFNEGRPLNQQDQEVLRRDCGIWQQQAETIAQQAQFILDRVGSVQNGGLSFEGSKHYSLFANADQLYVLAANRGVPPTAEDRQVLPSSLLSAERGIILKKVGSEIQSDQTRTTSTDLRRFNEYARWVQTQAAQMYTPTTPMPGR